MLKRDIRGSPIPAPVTAFSQGKFGISLALASIPAGHLFFKGFFRFAGYRESVLERIKADSISVSAGAGEAERSCPA
jgi:hypothetical protein